MINAKTKKNRPRKFCVTSSNLKLHKIHLCQIEKRIVKKILQRYELDENSHKNVHNARFRVFHLKSSKNKKKTFEISDRKTKKLFLCRTGAERMSLHLSLHFPSFCRHTFIGAVDNCHIHTGPVLVEAFDQWDDIGILVVRIVLVALVDSLDDGIRVGDSFLGPAFLVVDMVRLDHL